jgi:hypothetical protein
LPRSIATSALRRCAERSAVVVVEHDDAGVVVAEPELVLGAQHAGRHDALHRLGAERDRAAVRPRQRRTDLRPQHLAAGRGDVARAAHDLGRCPTALGDHVDQRQLLGLGVRPLAGDLGDHHAGEPGAERGQALDLEPTAGQRTRPLLGGRLAIQVAQLEQPAPQHLHGARPPRFDNHI